MVYDVVVIGAGPGGYVCAIKAAQLGLKVALIEKQKTYGGTCLNIGCIPSKALLYASDIYQQSIMGFDEIGVKLGQTPELDLPAMMEYKQKVVDANTSGVSYLLQKNNIDRYHGHARIIAAQKIEITTKDGGTEEITGQNIVIATGSKAALIPGLDVKYDEEKILSSTGALSLKQVPNKMVVIGAGVIGSELGAVWSRLGASVTIIEYQDKALGKMDAELSKKFQKTQEKEGIHYKFGAKVTSVAKQENGVAVRFESAANVMEASQTAETIEADVVLVATGRTPFTEGLGLVELGIKQDKSGRIEVGADFKTNYPSIYAIGDVIQGPMLAHKSEEEGVAVAEILAGQKGHVNYDTIPAIVYTEPEAASVGQTEEALKAAGTDYRVGKFPFSANGRARAMGKTDGFVKILASAKTDRVLGGHILGHGASEMIQEIAILMEFSGASEDLARTCFAHPTMSEAVKEAALATFAKPLHM